MIECFQRAALIDLIWKEAESTVFIGKEDFARGLEGWRIYPVIDGGVMLAIVIEKGPEFHFYTMRSGRAFPRRLIVEVMQHLIDRHGYAVTKTPLDDERQHRFNRLIGFEVTGKDEYDVHYRIDRIRGRPVPQE